MVPDLEKEKKTKKIEYWVSKVIRGVYEDILEYDFKDIKGPKTKLTECAPALSPMIVTLSGSPPKAFTFSLTHANNIV